MKKHQALLAAAAGALLIAAAAWAVPPAWVAKLPGAQADLLAHEQALAKKAPRHPLVNCRVIYEAEPVIDCATYTLTANPAAKAVQAGAGQTWWISRLTDAYLMCSFRFPRRCLPSPCNFRVTVRIGADLAVAGFSGTVNVCVKGWAARIK